MATVEYDAKVVTELTGQHTKVDTTQTNGEDISVGTYFYKDEVGYNVNTSITLNQAIGFDDLIQKIEASIPYVQIDKIPRYARIILDDSEAIISVSSGMGPMDHMSVVNVILITDDLTENLEEYRVALKGCLDALSDDDFNYSLTPVEPIIYQNQNTGEKEEKYDLGPFADFIEGINEEAFYNGHVDDIAPWRDHVSEASDEYPTKDDPEKSWKGLDSDPIVRNIKQDAYLREHCPEYNDEEFWNKELSDIL